MVASKPVDFRKGMDSLAALVMQALSCDPFTGDDDTADIDAGTGNEI